MDIVFAPNLADRPKQPKGRWQTLLKLCSKGETKEWTCKKKAKDGDLYLFWVGAPVYEIMAIGVSDGKIEEYSNPGKWDWTDAEIGWFCGFKPLTRIDSPITIADIYKDPILSAWWKTKPYMGRPKTLLTHPKVARRLISIIKKQNPKLRQLFSGINQWLIGKTPHPPRDPGIVFISGYKPKRGSAKVQTKKERKTILLHENILQHALYNILCNKYGMDSVGTEIRTSAGCSIDVAVYRKDTYIFYEIKADTCIRTCLRDGIGQLIEYAFWASINVPQKLIVVSECTLTVEAKKYLKTLRKTLHVPVYYQKLDLKTKSLSALQ